MKLNLPKLIGHRGMKSILPENTIDSIYKAIEFNFKWIEIDVKNRIEIGDELEYISPDNQYRFTLDAMEKTNGLSIDVAHGGNGLVRIKTDRPVEPFALISLSQKRTVSKAQN